MNFFELKIRKSEIHGDTWPFVPEPIIMCCTPWTRWEPAGLVSPLRRDSYEHATKNQACICMRRGKIPALEHLYLSLGLENEKIHIDWSTVFEIRQTATEMNSISRSFQLNMMHRPPFHLPPSLPNSSSSFSISPCSFLAASPPWSPERQSTFSSSSSWLASPNWILNSQPQAGRRHHKL